MHWQHRRGGAPVERTSDEPSFAFGNDCVGVWRFGAGRSGTGRRNCAGVYLWPISMVPGARLAERSTTAGGQLGLGHECLPHLLVRLRRADQGSCPVLGRREPVSNPHSTAAAAASACGLPAVVPLLCPLAVRRPLATSAEVRDLGTSRAPSPGHALVRHGGPRAVRR
jgi:hypothetical protein